MDILSYTAATDAQFTAEQSLINAKPWQPHTTYATGMCCIFNSNFWLCSMSHQSTNVFDTGYWQELNSDASRINGYLTDLANLQDGCSLVFNASTNKFEARIINNTPSSNGATINDSGSLGNTTQTYSIDKIITLLNQKVSTGSIALVAITGSYNDLIQKPFIPLKISDLTNDQNFVTSTAMNNSLINKADLVNGKIPSSQIPAIAITDTFTANSDSLMTQLVAQTGDLCVRPDKNQTYILSGTDSSVLSDWTILPTPTGAVQSVNGQTGVIVLNSDNISQGTSNLYATVTEKTSWNNKLDKISSPTAGNIAKVNSDGSVGDSGVAINGFALSSDLGNKSNLQTTVKTDFVGAINEVFQSGVNVKNNVVTAVNAKNTLTPVTTSSTWAEVTTAISNIPSTSFSGNNIIEDTKLNITASVGTPYIKTINLTNAIVDSKIIYGVREFIQSYAQTNLVSTFDNADSANFVSNPKIDYDGAMHLGVNTGSGSMTNNTVSNTGITSGEEWTYTFDKTQYNSLESITFVDNTTPSINALGTYFPQIVTTNNDINITGITALNGIVFNATTSGGGVCLLAVSVDGGTTYKTYNQGTSTWNTVDITSVNDFASNGMSKAITDTLTSAQLETLRESSAQIRFAYYLSVTNMSSIANNLDISIAVQMPGYYQLANKADYDVLIGTDNKSIQFKMYKSSTYTFNVVDN